MSGEANDGERALDGAQPPAWESVKATQGLPEILSPSQHGQSYNTGPRGYPPPPTLPNAAQGQGTYRPVYDGMGPQGYGVPPPPPGAYGYGAQYPPYYGNNYNGAEMLAVAVMLPWYRRRIRRTILGTIFMVFFLLFVASHLVKMLFHAL